MIEARTERMNKTNKIPESNHGNSGQIAAQDLAVSQEVIVCFDFEVIGQKLELTA